MPGILAGIITQFLLQVTILCKFVMYWNVFMLHLIFVAKYNIIGSQWSQNKAPPQLKNIQKQAGFLLIKPVSETSSVMWNMTPTPFKFGAQSSFKKLTLDVLSTNVIVD